MRTPFALVLVLVLCLAGCAQSSDTPAAPAAPLAPTAVLSSSPGDVDVPFHSEVAWTKVEGSQTSLCTQVLPEGKVYLMRNTQTGTAVSTHLGAGSFLGHTCVYGPPSGPPQGWFADFTWTAANGDTLRATSEFLYWTGTPGKSVAVDKMTFRDGGTGRFQFAEGEGMVHVNAPARTAAFDGTLRYGKKDK